MALAIWHANLGRKWSDFVTDLRRATGVDVQYVKTWEAQARGALHAHAMLRLNGVCTDRRFRAAVRMLARRHGFGKQIKCETVDLSDARTAARVAGYCAKYATKNADALPTVQRLDTASGEITTGGMRAWSSSHRWGLTMKSIRLLRTDWAASHNASNAGASRGAGVGAAGGGAALDLNTDISAGHTHTDPPSARAELEPTV